MKSLIWAHRGASAYAPENTMAAFEKAIEMQADGIELDVHLSADGEVIVAHDDDVDRVSDGTGLINDMTLAQLRQLDFSKVRPESGRQHAPVLAEVLELLKPTSLLLNIEFKIGVRLYPGLEQKCFDLVHDAGMQERIVYSSFDHYTLMRMREIDANASIAPLFTAVLYEPWDYAKQLGADAIHPMRASLRAPGLVEGCKKAGVEVRAWTVDDSDEIGLCLQAGIEGIITNVPDIALQLRKQIQGV